MIQPISAEEMSAAYGAAVMRMVKRPLAAIVDEVSEETGIPVSEIRGDSRVRRIAHARQAAMWLARKRTNASLTEIGRFFNRDHSTVISNIRAVEARIHSKET